MYHIILASSSPRRNEILRQVGINFIIIPSNINEAVEFTDPEETVKMLSAMKAGATASKVTEDAIIIGADTVVALEGKIMGKPKDKEDAFHMLTGLSGKTHQVYTGVNIVIKKKQKAKAVSFCEVTDVSVSQITEQRIREYIETGEPMDKAGAYGIQGKFASFIESIKGDYYNVVGLPINRIYMTLLQEGIDLFSL